ncbi:hypothetical protein KC851_00305 [Candidatus Kaiserbacteria bacterium]|nr:hypothetical protein [Candidatus Kaiserbacteria bacterium]
MKKIGFLTGSASILALPMVASAQLANSGDGGAFQDLLENIVDFTNDILIPFIIAIGFLVFVWGMFRYFIAGGANDEAKQSGKSLMIWATLGFVLIIVFWGVINLIASSTGLEGDNIDDIPTADVFGA